ncbi:recombinase family protein [Streptomyces sp. NPDC004111]|uniref:recombinase family protein n=1 Tax=Streptomyces sp. NPDC004111 TaxID=3364690 RepID=UPI0036C4C622
MRISYRKPEDENEDQQTDAERRRAEFSKGIGRQEEDGRALAKRLGWTVTKVIPEDDTSAYKRRKIRLPDGSTGLRTVRPGFRAALEMLASGECDGLIADDLDRVARDPRDLEDLIDVVESRRPRIPVESVTGSLRLANDADITMARIMCAVANKSSRDTARRVARKHEQLAQEGKPGGGGFRGYGFTDQYDVIDDEAEILQEIGARILGTWDGWTREQRAKINPEIGESNRSIAEDLRRRGVPTVTGAPWSGRTVGSVISKPSVAGLRAHKKEVIGEATWPAIIERSQWEEICIRLAARAGTTDLTLQRWLNGALRCPFCKHMLTGSHGNSGPRYWCATPRGGCGKVAIKAEPAEEEVGNQVVDLLSRPKVLQRLQRVATTDVSDEARAELAADEEQLKELARMWARREISFSEYTEARGIIEKRVKESRALVVSVAPRILRGLLAGDVRAGWERLAPTEKREVLLTIVPGYEVMPHDRSRGNRFQPDRLVPIKPE